MSRSFHDSSLMLKRLLALLTTVTLAASAAPRLIHDGSLADAHIQYIGRWDRTDPAAYHSYWSTAYLRVGFTGTTVKAKVSGGLMAFIDGKPVTPSVCSEGLDLTPATLPPGNHTLLLASAGQNEELIFRGLVLEADAQTVEVPERPLIEFVGDSITACAGKGGTGVDNCAWQAAEALDCDHVRVAFSGVALTTGLGFFKDKTGFDRWYFLLKNCNHSTNNPPWDFSYKPRLVVLNLGTNDSKDGKRPSDAEFGATYAAFLRAIRARLPEAELVAVRPFGGFLAGGIRLAVRELANTGDARVHYIDTEGWLGKDDFVDGIHPTVAGHARAAAKLAAALKPFLSSRLTLKVQQQYLNLPIRNGGPKRKVTLFVEGRPEVINTIELADSGADWWAPMDVSQWRGKTVTLEVDKLPAGSGALRSIEPGDELKGAGDLYREPLRPQLHFSSKRGWNNDPNGLVYYKGEYHLFYQHNPYGWSWGNMHWGHAVSRDLVRWTELGDVLAPDQLGPMFSGSAVVDHQNTIGLGKPGEAPLVLIYTACGNPAVQCLASSTDGRTFTKYPGNPVVKQIAGGNRDPKVFWHKPSQRWVMTLYVGFSDPAQKDAHGKPARKDTIQLVSSPNLKDWTVMSQVEGFYECPDLFELPLDGDGNNKKWVLTAASSEYRVGSFNGTAFTPETQKLPGQGGRGFYAAQTFSDLPRSDGRRIQVGWLQADSPGMPFNQALSLPLELKLVSTPAGSRLTWTPVKELESLRARSHRFGPLSLKPGEANPLAAVHAELMELRAEFEPGQAGEVGFTVRGVPISYDAAKQELVVKGHRAPAPLRQGKQRLVVYVDRTALEVFASDGLTYVPMPHIAEPQNQSVDAAVKGGAVAFQTLEVHELKSIWRLF